MFYTCAARAEDGFAIPLIKRLVSLSAIVARRPELRSQVLTAPWREVCIVHASPRISPIKRGEISTLFPLHGIPSPFYIPQHFFVPDSRRAWLQPKPLSSPATVATADKPLAPIHVPAMPNEDPELVTFVLANRWPPVAVQFGRCDARPSSGPKSYRDSVLGPPWVHVHVHQRDTPLTLHDCSVDHVEEWQDGIRVFEVDTDENYNPPLLWTLEIAFIPLASASGRYALTRLELKRTTGGVGETVSAVQRPTPSEQNAPRSLDGVPSMFDMPDPGTCASILLTRLSLTQTSTDADAPRGDDAQSHSSAQTREPNDAGRRACRVMCIWIDRLRLVVRPIRMWVQDHGMVRVGRRSVPGSMRPGR